MVGQKQVHSSQSKQNVNEKSIHTKEEKHYEYILKKLDQGRSDSRRQNHRPDRRGHHRHHQGVGIRHADQLVKLGRLNNEAAGLRRRQVLYKYVLRQSVLHVAQF